MPHDTTTNYGVAEGGARVTLDETKTILLVGVGGQGTILASRLIASAAMAADIPIKTAETIGMAQRGGSVMSHLRLGERGVLDLVPIHFDEDDRGVLPSV